MRIAVVHNLPGGGQKRALYEQVKRLSKKHTLDLYTLATANETYLPLKKFVRHHHVIYYRYPSHFPFSIASIYFELPIVYSHMADKINKEGYDAVYVNPCFLTQSPFFLRYLKIPSLYYCPEPKREFYEKIPRVSNQITYFLTYSFRIPIKYIDITNTRHASRIITNSVYSKNRIDRIYGVQSKVNYLGVDADIFNPYSDSSTSEEASNTTSEVSLSLIEAKKFVLTVGEISLHKGHDFLIRSIAHIPPEIRPELIIVSHGGSEKVYITGLAKDRHVKLKIMENITDEKLVQLYRQAKAMVYAPVNEPFGMALLEALACGLPIVAVHDGGVKEIINSPKMGILTDRDEHKFAQALQKTISHPLDFRKRKMKHEWVKERWGWEKSVSELEKHLRQTANLPI